MESELWAELKMLGLEPGNTFFNQEVTIRKTVPIVGFNLAGKWLGKYRNIITKEPWYILTSLADLQVANVGMKKKKIQFTVWLSHPEEFDRIVHILETDGIIYSVEPY